MSKNIALGCIGAGPLKRDRTGLYSTPSEAIDALFKYLPSEWKSFSYMEPCAGEGAVVNALEKLGIHTAYSCDIEPKALGVDKRDFLTEVFDSRGAKAVVTNPPFALFDKFVFKCLSLGIHKSAWLLKVNTFSALKRSDFFEVIRPAFKLDLSWRLDFLGGGSPQMDCCWVVYDGLSAKCEYDILRKE